jgi:hypothetical protein
MPHNILGCMKFEAAHDQTFQSPTPEMKNPAQGRVSGVTQ